MIYIVALESIETRYTKHWFEYVPDQIASATGKLVTQIVGNQLHQKPTEGAFLNFASTNIWKNDQASAIAHLFATKQIADGDYFLFMDAWNPTAIEVRYMADLFGVDIKIGAIWHAGSYDSHDFLGRKIKNKKWAFQFERSLYELYDHNFFATQYHIDLIEKVLGVKGKSYRVGFPMEYYTKVPITSTVPKENLVVFPHRISEEKQPELFRKLASLLPEYEFVICQEKSLTKAEYHSILSRAKIVFSANLQETLGIGVVEGMMAGAIPLVPDRLSYCEMYYAHFRYYGDEEADLVKLAARIRSMMERYDNLYQLAAMNLDMIRDKFFTGTEMYKIIKGDVV